MGSRLLLVAALVTLACAQYSVWQVTYVYPGANCTGEVAAEFATPILVTLCSNSSDLGPCQVASSTDTLPGAWQRTGCAQSTPGVDLSYRFFAAPIGDGFCVGKFNSAVSLRAGCTSMQFEGGPGAIRPVCFANQTAVFRYTDSLCASTPTPVYSVFLKPNYAKCSVDLNNNQSFYLTTCPVITPSAAPGRVLGLMCLVLAAVALFL